VVYSLFSYHQKNLGDPGSSRGMLERIRVGLTVYISKHVYKNQKISQKILPLKLSLCGKLMCSMMMK
jgi:hypothetical protein